MITSVRRQPRQFCVCAKFNTATDAVDNNGIVFVSDGYYTFEDIAISYTTASTSGTLRPRKLATTKAPGDAAGTGVVELTTATLSLSGTANTAISGTPTTTVADRFLVPGDRIALDFGGTVTNLTGLCVTITLRNAAGRHKD